MSEKFYDDVIAPKLLEISNLCKENGLSFVGAVEWPESSLCYTLIMQKDATIAVRLVEVSAKANGNFDAMAFAILRYAKENNIRNDSIVLRAATGDFKL